MRDPANPEHRPFLAVFPAIMLPMFLAMIDQTIVAAALPAMAVDLGNVERISWVVVFYLVAAAISAPVAGRLGDIFGRRTMLGVLTLVSMAGALLCAVAPSFEWLVATRALQGLGGGGMMALSQSLIGQYVAPRERARHQGYIAAIMVTSSMIGPIVGGLSTELFGWRSVFLVNLPVGVLALFLVLRLPAITPARKRDPFDWPGLMLFALFIVTLISLVNSLAPPQTASRWTLVALAAGALAFLGLLALQERRARSPLLPASVLANASIWRSNVLTVSHGAVLVSLITFTPIYMRSVHGATAAEIGLLMLPMSVGIGIGSMVTGQLVARTGRTTVFPATALALLAMLLVVLAVSARHLTATEVSMLLGLCSLLLGSVMNVVHVTVMSEAPARFLGTASGTVQLSRSLGAAVGTSLVSAVFFLSFMHYGVDDADRFRALMQADAAMDHAAHAQGLADAFTNVFITIAAFATLGLVMALTVPRRHL